MLIIFYFKNFHISEILVNPSCILQIFSPFVPHLMWASQQSQGRDWQNRWNYPHLIDVETDSVRDTGWWWEALWFMVSLLSLVAPSCPAAPAGPWQHPLVLWGPEEGWGCPSPCMRWVNVHNGMWPGAFPPWTSPGGNPELDPGYALSSQIEPKETVINPSISIVLASCHTLYSPVLCEGPFLLSRLLIGQHSFQCFVNLRDNTPLILICIIWPLSLFVGFFFFVGMAVNYLIFFSELFMSFVQLSWGAHLHHGFVNIPFYISDSNCCMILIKPSNDLLMLFAFIFMFTKDFTTILVCLLWLNKQKLRRNSGEGAGVGTAGTLRVGIGGIRTRDTKDSKALISRPRSISTRGCRKKIPALLLMRTLRFYRKTEHT